MAEAFPISGQIDPKAFPFLLMDLNRHGATGSLKVEGPSYQKALYYRNGRILFGSSNDPRDQLGAILIEAGRISPEQLEDVNTKVGPGNPLAKALADSGFVSQRELGDAARAKVERILSDVVAYQSGSFEFEDGVLPKGAVDLKLSTEKLVVEAVRRVSDRSFVLRHLDDLEVRLSPTPEMEQRLPEVRSECGGLPEHFDGHTTLKAAAAAARLEEFEAAKIACALLFLGMLARGGAELARSTEPELDLAGTAREAFEPDAEAEGATFVIRAPEESAPILAAESAPTVAAEPAPILTDDPLSRTEPGEPLFIPAEPPIPPPALARPPSLEEPDDSPTLPPPKPEPTVSMPARAASSQRPARAEPAAAPPIPAPKPEPQPAPRPPIVPPPARPAFDAAAAVPARPPRPSKEDLAALDALLTGTAVEGPLTPLDKPAGRDTAARVVPPSPVGRRASGGPSMLVVGGLAALALSLAAAGAGWYFFLRQPGPVRQVRATPPPLPTLAPTTTTVAPATLPAASEPPAPTTTVLAPTQAATPPPAKPSAAPSLAPHPTPPPTAPPPTPAPQSPAPVRTASAGSLADARDSMQKGRLKEASQVFAANIKAGATPFSVQVLVACSEDTIDKALQSVSAPELYILPVHYKGKDCFRVMWGLYDTHARADSAMRSVPEYFRKGGATPKVVPTASILP